MNILLFESHYRSRSWFKALDGLGDIFIVSVNKEEKELFLLDGVKEENILDLHNPNLADISLSNAIDYLSKMESSLDFCVNNIVMMDRTLRLTNHEYIAKYVYLVLLKIHEFIKSKDINIVFMEPTWTHEIVSCLLCKHLNIPVFGPTKCKILPNRFFLFTGYLNNEHFIRKNATNGKELASSLVDTVLAYEKKPQYFDHFVNKNKFKLEKFKVLYNIIKLSILGKSNVNIQPPWIKSVRKKLTAILRSPYLLKFARFVKQSDISSPYILIPLHVQPEATIDVLGAKFTDQIDFVRQIVRTTPVDHLIVVKEHPHAIGDRDSHFYKQLTSMSRVLILNPYEDSRMAIERASFVISNTGTGSLEAAIIGIPSVTATEMYFNELLVSPSFNPVTDSVADLLIKSEAWKKKFSIINIKDQLSNIKKNTFEGNPGAFNLDPTVLSNSNIDNLKLAFSEAINFYTTSRNK